ncbi:MAG: hypothetical protein NC924_03020, partial [Candidatus Omnitrophica bacterium]|nr:hypothetical protein [Candidatus Omnitrophota bacterium]
VPGYLNAVERGRASKGKGNLDTARKAVSQFALVNQGTLPAGLAAVAADANLDFDDSNLNNDADWNYAYAPNANGPNTFTITATRTGGPNTNGTITVDQDGVVTYAGQHPTWE